MKFKFITFIIIIAVMLPLFMVPTLASSNVVDISRPDGNEIVTKEVFSICGVTIEDEAYIEFYYKDKEADQYKPLLTTEGKYCFKVGKIFGKDIELKYKGKNEIRIKAYTTATKNDPQIENYTITLVEEKKKENWLEKALNWFTGDEKK
ncbi:hypothetical protein LY28_02314 [Ruminiclostridium sufflavum DSM 19573]|uniref:Uncharacterized protein n=1 Tax=Ruminiclostridium sufflavum DSM 19573 TaxID=1121337 RepID=A0A318XL47_9FIRM|nr:hypothetical protein [Ruminiclostridium sufflavum]PYG87178.1 hypothetical protein LY28_02314 [Ruminiclostridium sufflavum DSM 19573]